MKTSIFEKLAKGELVHRGEPVRDLEHLAELLGYNPEYLGRLRSGNAPITSKFWGRLLNVFGPQAATWVWEEDQEPPVSPIPGVSEIRAPDPGDEADVARFGQELAEAVS